MVQSSTPLVPLQAPKDVSIDEIEAELAQIWQGYLANQDGVNATRATTFTLIIYEPEETQRLLAALDFYNGPVDGLSGPKTTAAIKSAQKAYGLTVTGNSNPELQAKLKSAFIEAKAAGKVSEAEANAVDHYSPDLQGAGIADAIATSNPCRIITVCPTAGEDEGVTAQVSAYCPIQKRSQRSLICCEYITLQGTSSALDRIGGIISALVVSELPKFVWWKATPEPDYGLFKRLCHDSDAIIIDSSTFNDPESNLLLIAELLSQGIRITDLNWSRLSPWQELAAQAFDPPERRAAIYEVDQVTIDYEKGNSTQALMYLGWLATRLQWRPVAYEYEGGDYDIRRVKLVNPQGKEIKAELGGIPLADWGNVLGDLISLRLSSTNLNADCCTVLCSETAGCMRMEASGGAQACRIQQVTSVSDQNTEILLGQQLQNRGRDPLYIETMKVTEQILKLIES
ncbi:glucose-6-phosphate dehydrogenase assembly protein OpcA [Gloeocapsa sp. PCC 73106]|uniref:glucose-6-phosphate dehydrogenase assembly protein OpcA n=1 Tax=Gloeocapsa sp. PCC 73106 TaxID=102232 RepID=UPI0002AC94B6|nr:glucose-6-phosphate dehydrogenase assembly protein OpcA [Gloeocapsa sp. PCC 73106]ELR97907.1 opcA protein [Gloeocapsa sp. PCC 73106]